MRKTNKNEINVKEIRKKTLKVKKNIEKCY